MYHSTLLLIKRVHRSSAITMPTKSSKCTFFRSTENFEFFRTYSKVLKWFSVAWSYGLYPNAIQSRDYYVQLDELLIRICHLRTEMGLIFSENLISMDVTSTYPCWWIYEKKLLRWGYIFPPWDVQFLKCHPFACRSNVCHCFSLFWSATSN